MSKNNDRDVVIIESRPVSAGKDKIKLESRRSGSDFRSNKNISGSSRDNKDHRKSGDNNNNRLVF